MRFFLAFFLLIIFNPAYATEPLNKFNSASVAFDAGFEFDAPHGKISFAHILKENKGKWLVINFWATWCPPCVREMPALDRLAADYEKKNVKIVALALEREGVPVASAFFKRRELRNLAPYADPSAYAMRFYKLRGLPTTLFINPEGQEVGRLLTEQDWDSPALRAWLDDLVRPSASPSSPARL